MNVCIIGMGLIGGSLGLALKKNSPKTMVCGVVHKKSAIREVMERRAADSVFLNPVEGIKEADWIVLATGPRQFEPILNEIAPFLKQNQIVTDVGSVKESVMILYRKILKKRVPYIGSHPIAGSEKKGIESARVTLFEGARCIVTPDQNTSPEVLRQTLLLWKKIKAKPVVQNALEHDRIYARVSHLPHLVSFCLANTLLRKEDYLKYAGEAWQDMTRIAHSSPELWTEISLLNRTHILGALKNFSNEIDNIKKYLKSSNAKSLKKILEKSKKILTS